MPDRITAWWNAFVAQTPRIDALFRGGEPWDLAAWMQDNLGPVHSELMWEFGPAVHHAGHRLVITPESRRDLRPLVRELLRAAPELPDWEFYEYRLPEDFAEALSSAEVRTGSDVSRLQFQAQPGDFNRVDILFISPEWDDDDGLRAASFIAAECLLGEELLERWVGVIDFALEPDEEAPPARGLSELAAVVQRLVSTIQDELPDRPLHTRDLDAENWSVFELTPPTADDFPDQSDLFVCTTMLPRMWENALVGAPFDSARYSRCGERFCYLKLEGKDTPVESFQDRTALENALNDALRPAALGCVVGGGTGSRYNYIELALVDVDRAWHTIQLLLQGAGAPPCTWLLFHDSECASDWRGLFETTPPPPRSAVQN